MPWKAVGNKIEKMNGEVVGKSTSHKKAEASVRARYANANPRDEAIKGYNKRRMKKSTDIPDCGEMC